MLDGQTTAALERWIALLAILMLDDEEAEAACSEFDQGMDIEGIRAQAQTSTDAIADYVREYRTVH